jgi:glycerate 2-kinase
VLRFTALFLSIMNLSGIARELFAHTLQHLNIEHAMQFRLRCEGETLHIGDRPFPLQGFRRIALIAIGKAAAPMTDALLLRIEPMLRKDQALEGIAVGTMPSSKQDSRIAFFQGSHPLPSSMSEIAADAILNLLAACDDACLVFFLMSGGASAMVEKALDETIPAEDVAHFHRSLLHSGLPIAQMNTLRKHFSRVKGGRLAAAATGVTQCTLLISDVPENSLDIVGSGPSLPDPSTLTECRRIIDDKRASLNLPESVLHFFWSDAVEETPKADHPAFQRANWIPLLSSDDLLEAAEEAAMLRGFHVTIDNNCDDWDYRDAAVYLLDRLKQLRQMHRRVCLLSAGEVSVAIPATHGVGGRNQQFALECARLIATKRMNATVLSGGSDGVDGNSTAAGAVCDESSVARAKTLGIDVTAGLEKFDSGNVFATLGDAIVTGPTGNNVRDLRILLSED